MNGTGSRWHDFDVREQVPVMALGRRRVSSAPVRVVPLPGNVPSPVCKLWKHCKPYTFVCTNIGTGECEASKYISASLWENEA